MHKPASGPDLGVACHLFILRVGWATSKGTATNLKVSVQLGRSLSCVAVEVRMRRSLRTWNRSPSVTCRIMEHGKSLKVRTLRAFTQGRSIMPIEANKSSANPESTLEAHAAAGLDIADYWCVQ